MKTIRTAQQLANNELIEVEKLKKIEQVLEKFSVSVTPQLVDRMQTGSDQDKEAIRKQFLPNEQELNIMANEFKDPIGDSIHAKTKGIVHRYPDRCLLMPINACPAYCRFCFRREVVGSKGNRALSNAELAAAYAYIVEHNEIWEVILTGGDPLILKPKKIAEILSALEDIPHVEVVRIHTRVPVVNSIRVTDELIQALKINKAVYVALHCNHPGEFTEEVKTACARFVDAGIPLLGQTVLLKDINDTPEVMGKLMRTLVKNRIKPYYLHHGELAEGTSHFRTTIEQGQKLMKSLRGHYSGLCQPTYVLEIPGGFGKMPISYQYLKLNKGADSLQKSYSIEDFQGKHHCYVADQMEFEDAK